MRQTLIRLLSRGSREHKSQRAPRRSAARPVVLAERIERTPALDPTVQALSAAVVRAMPAGPRTDALHGVPFGQPAHPAIVRFPLGCWTSAVLLDLMPGTARASRVLIGAGLAAVLPSAATGLADWSALHRHQQRVGLVHAAAQGSAGVMFAASFGMRMAGRHRDGKLLSAAGLTALLTGTYLGGHLALRLGAGASHAEPIGHLAGLGWQDLCPLSGLPDGRPVRRQLGYLSLAVLRSGADVYVLSDHCAHLGGPLHQGRIAVLPQPTSPDRPPVPTVTCPWHGSTFRLTDGAVVHGPATARQPAFETRISETGLVQVRPTDRPLEGEGSSALALVPVLRMVQHFQRSDSNFVSLYAVRPFSRPQFWSEGVQGGPSTARVDALAAGLPACAAT